MNIKGRSFGTGKPVICVPVVERTAEDIISKIQAMTAAHVDMIEWRMDWYEDIGRQEAVLKLLKQIEELVRNTVLLCTFRSRKQGGEKEIAGGKYLQLNQLAAGSGVPDLIDLEFYEVTEPGHIIGQLKKNGVKVVCSNHNFEGTPDTDVMKQQLLDMAAAGADFAKLAVMPQKKQDVLRLMEAVLDVKTLYPDSHLIAMSMGKDGVISRLLGSWFYSEVTFAAFDRTSAPGQVAYDKAEQLLEQLEAHLNKNDGHKECIR